MGQDCWRDVGKRDAFGNDSLLGAAHPENAVRMVAAAAHGMDHVKEIPETPPISVAAPRYGPVQHFGTRDAATGKNACAFALDGHERLIVDG